MGEQKLSSEIISLLDEICNHEIENFDILVHEDSAVGQGYLGELVSHNEIFSF